MTTQEMFSALLLNYQKNIRKANGIDVYTVMQYLYNTYGKNKTLVLTPDKIEVIDSVEWKELRRNRNIDSTERILIDTESDGWSSVYFTPA